MLFFSQDDPEINLEGRTAEDWLFAAAIFVGSIVIAVALARIVRAFVDRRDSEHFVAQLLGRLAGFVVVAAGLVYALRSLRIPIGPVLGALGIGGLALAFALQEILGNIFAGVLLQIRRPFLRGHQVLTNDYEGTVRDVNMRAVVIRTFDGQRVFVPNLQVLKNPIVNYTVLGQRRTTLMVGVTYDTDLERAESVLLDAVGRVEDVWGSPPPQAYIEQFGESSIDFALRYWHDPDIETTWRVRHEVVLAVKTAFDRAGIVIAFPQRTLWLGDADGIGRWIGREAGEERG